MGLLYFDHQLTYAVHTLPHNEISNEIARFFSLDGWYVLIWLIFLFYIIYSSEINRSKSFLLSILSGYCAYFVANMLKICIQRFRPLTGSMSEKISIFFTYPSDYSFPSVHTAGAFALAYVLSYFRKKYTVPLYVTAFFISLSRVYLGYHYVSDIVAGAIIGTCTSAIFIYYEKKSSHTQRATAQKSKGK